MSIPKFENIECLGCFFLGGGGGAAPVRRRQPARETCLMTAPVQGRSNGARQAGTKLETHDKQCERGKGTEITVVGTNCSI